MKRQNKKSPDYEYLIKKLDEIIHDKEKEHIEAFAEKSSTSEKKTKKQQRKIVFFASASLLLLLTTAALGYQCYALTKTNQTISSEKDELSSLYNTEKNKAERYWSDYKILQDKYSSVSKKYETLSEACDLIYLTYPNEINGALSSGARASLDVWKTIQKVDAELVFSLLADDIRRGAASPSTQNSISTKKIKIGGSKQSVVDACGSPDRMVDTAENIYYENAIWYYGTSWVEFDLDGEVRAWYIGDTQLPVE